MTGGCEAFGREQVLPVEQHEGVHVMGDGQRLSLESDVAIEDPRDESPVPPECADHVIHREDGAALPHVDVVGGISHADVRQRARGLGCPPTRVDIGPRDDFDFDLDPRIRPLELVGRPLHFFGALGLGVRVPESNHSFAALPRRAHRSGNDHHQHDENDECGFHCVAQHHTSSCCGDDCHSLQGPQVGPGGTPATEDPRIPELPRAVWRCPGWWDW